MSFRIRRPDPPSPSEGQSAAAGLAQLLVPLAAEDPRGVNLQGKFLLCSFVCRARNALPRFP
jgi:hypothetical protein